MVQSTLQKGAVPFSELSPVNVFNAPPEYHCGSNLGPTLYDAESADALMSIGAIIHKSWIMRVSIAPSLMDCQLKIGSLTNRDSTD